MVECKEPIEVVSYKIGVCKVSPSGKDCTTTFQKIGFNGHSSVVLCKPLTGRMHQIRVHLQYLGRFPRPQQQQQQGAPNINCFAVKRRNHTQAVREGGLSKRRICFFLPSPNPST